MGIFITFMTPFILVSSPSILQPFFATVSSRTPAAGRPWGGRLARSAAAADGAVSITMAGAPAPSAGSGGDHHRSHRAEVGRLIDLSSARASRPSGGWPGGRGTTVDTFPWDGKLATAAAAAADASSSSGTRARAGAQGQGAGGGDGVTFGEAAGASITDRARARGLKPYVPTSGEVAPKGGWRVSPQEPIPGGHTIPFKSKPKLGVGALSDRPWCDDRPGCCPRAAVHTVCAMLRIIHPSPAMPCHRGSLARAAGTTTRATASSAPATASTTTSPRPAPRNGRICGRCATCVGCRCVLIQCSPLHARAFVLRQGQAGWGPERRCPCCVVVAAAVATSPGVLRAAVRTQGGAAPRGGQGPPRCLTNYPQPRPLSHIPHLTSPAGSARGERGGSARGGSAALGGRGMRQPCY
jgi:hypothetical protein